MIPAAGKGTRLQPPTNYLPKPGLALPGRPVLETIIELLAGHDADDLIINTSHRAPEIEHYLRDSGGGDVNIACAFEGQLAGDTLHTRAPGSAGAVAAPDRQRRLLRATRRHIRRLRQHRPRLAAG